jgi:hypothetical protein
MRASKAVIASDPELDEGERGDPELYGITHFLDCFVAPLLARTGFLGFSHY